MSKHSTTCAAGKRLRNMTSLLIVAIGLIAGLLFVDVAQLFTQRGLSARALGEAQIVSYDGATWVKYDEPRVRVDVFVSDECTQKCAMVDDVLLELRRYIPTLEAHRVDVATQEGRDYARNTQVSTLPAFLFDKELFKTQFFIDTAPLFLTRDDNRYLLNLSEANITTYQLLDAPENDLGLIDGSEVATRVIHHYTDLLCETCDVSTSALKNAIITNEDWSVAYKFFTPEGDIVRRSGANTILCAQEQGHGYEMMSQLARSSAWHAPVDDALTDNLLKEVSSVRALDRELMAGCMAADQFSDILARMQNEIERYSFTTFPQTTLGQDVVTQERALEEIAKSHDSTVE